MQTAIWADSGFSQLCILSEAECELFKSISLTFINTSPFEMLRYYYVCFVAFSLSPLVIGPELRQNKGISLPETP